MILVPFAEPSCPTLAATGPAATGPAAAEAAGGAPAVMTFADGLAGFGGRRRFTLSRWGGDESPFSLLRSVDDADLAFVVVPPGLFFDDYQFDLGDDHVVRLGLESVEEALVLVIVTVPDRVQDATANLLGPLVVNTRTLVGVQAVLDPDRWPVRRRLVPSGGAATPAA